MVSVPHIDHLIAVSLRCVSGDAISDACVCALRTVSGSIYIDKLNRYCTKF